jgi:hypothetical protein
MDGPHSSGEREADGYERYRDEDSARQRVAAPRGIILMLFLFYVLGVLSRSIVG